MSFELGGFLVTAVSYVSLALSYANILLLLGLLYIYWGSYKELKSRYTTGLLFFAPVFTSNYYNSSNVNLLY